MENEAKVSIVAWWLLALISLFLWYRNLEYDRALAVYIFVLALIQLIEYAVYSGAKGPQAAKAMYVALWLQCLVLAIGVFVFTLVSKGQSNLENYQVYSSFLAGWGVFFFGVVFLGVLGTVFFGDDSFNAQVIDGQIVWTRNGQTFLADWGWLYLIGFFLPLVVLLFFYAWNNVGLYLLLLYGVLVCSYVLLVYPPAEHSQLYAYLSVGFAFLVWMLGMFY